MITYQEFFLLLLSGFVVESTGLNDFVIDVKLETSTRKHRLFDTLFRDESQYTNDFCLTNTMSTILGLKIGMRIPGMT